MSNKKTLPMLLEQNHEIRQMFSKIDFHDKNLKFLVPLGVHRHLLLHVGFSVCDSSKK